MNTLSCPFYKCVSHLEQCVKSIAVRAEAINVVYLLHCFVLSGLFPSTQTLLPQFIKPAVYAVHSSHPVLKLFYGSSLILALGM